MRRLKKNSLIVSCQAESTEPLHGSLYMQKMALAAKESGAMGIRANSPVDIKAIKEVVDLPIIGIHKDRTDEYTAFITTRKEHIQDLVESGVDLIAIDSTDVKRPEPLSELFLYVKNEYKHIKIVADVSNVDDVKKIIPLKPDYISTTLSSYTHYTLNRPKPDLDLISDIIKITNIPVLAEGNYHQPDQIREAILRGAYAVIVGGAITRPQQITQTFLKAIDDFTDQEIYAIGIDIGATNLRSVLTDRFGKIMQQNVQKTPKTPEEIIQETSGVIKRLSKTAPPTAVGIATAGRVDSISGKVLYATDNIKGWTGTELATEISKFTGYKPIINNDANMAAYGQWKYTGESSLALITVGTGIGGGIILNGHVVNGFLGGAAEFGHIVFPGNNKKCTCSKTGCIETLLSGKSLNGELKKSPNNLTQILEEYSSKIAWLIDTIQRVIEVEQFYLGGIIGHYGQSLINQINLKLLELDNIYPKDFARYTHLHEFAGALGAAHFSLDKAYNVKKKERSKNRMSLI